MKQATDQAPHPLSAAELDEVLAVLARRAPALRDAGIRRVTALGLAFDLDPPEPIPLTAEEMARRSAAARNPLLDASMYGRADGSTPGMRRHREYDDE